MRFLFVPVGSRTGYTRSEPQEGKKKNTANCIMTKERARAELSVSSIANFKNSSPVDYIIEFDGLGIMAGMLILHPGADEKRLMYLKKKRRRRMRNAPDDVRTADWKAVFFTATKTTQKRQQGREKSGSKLSIPYWVSKGALPNYKQNPLCFPFVLAFSLRKSRLVTGKKDQRRAATRGPPMGDTCWNNQLKSVKEVERLHSKVSLLSHWNYYTAIFYSVITKWIAYY